MHAREVLGIERISADVDDLSTVIGAVVVAVGIVRVGASLDLARIGQAVAVGVRVVRAGAVDHHLVVVAQPVAVGVRVVRVAAEDIQLVIIGEAVAIAVDLGGRARVGAVIGDEDEEELGAHLLLAQADVRAVHARTALGARRRHDVEEIVAVGDLHILEVDPVVGDGDVAGLAPDHGSAVDHRLIGGQRDVSRVGDEVERTGAAGLRTVERVDRNRLANAGADGDGAADRVVRFVGRSSSGQGGEGERDGEAEGGEEAWGAHGGLLGGRGEPVPRGRSRGQRTVGATRVHGSVPPERCDGVSGCVADRCLAAPILEPRSTSGRFAFERGTCHDHHSRWRSAPTHRLVYPFDAMGGGVIVYMIRPRTM